MSITHSSRWLACSAIIFVCALVSGCASAPVDESSIGKLATRAGGMPTERRLSYITAAELHSANATSTLDMIRTLRPEFLQASPRGVGPTRPAGPSLYENQTYLGDVSWLARIPLSEVRQVEFLHPAEARVRFGPMCVCDGGVLIVRTESMATYGNR